jgi:glyoxylase-like metal-dependent hydrolase (beta-lactamase superfamily II)
MISRGVGVALLVGLSIVLGQRPDLAAAEPPSPAAVRLYVIDNGRIQIDPAMFHFKREEVAEADMVAVSYLIVHPRGTLMWDTGMIADTAFKGGAEPVTVQRRGYVGVAAKTLKAQLQAIGYAPSQIDFLALSHWHGDHTANIDQFTKATWIVQRPERDAMFAASGGSAFASLRNQPTKILEGGDYDVFGDNTVVIKAAYGHSPGHQVLLVNLKNTGPVLLAGDLYHYPEERGTRKVPDFEFNPAQSLASRAAIERFLTASGARLWIEHDRSLFKTLKIAPDYYD